MTEIDRWDAPDMPRPEIPPAAMAPAPLPYPIPLRAFLDVDDDPVQYRIEGLLPVGGRAVVAAQFKSGKSIMMDNLTRCLADGDDFLGRFPTRVGRVTLIDDELDERMLRKWLRAQEIRNPDQVKVLTLRGQVASFNILDPQIRAIWADRLRGTEVLVFDCLRPVLDALGLSEDKDAGRFLVAFDALLKEAGIAEAVLVHHMGHNGERSRGDSRLRDWPDVEWRLVRNGDDPDSPRFFSAYGRDVDVAELAITFDTDTRHLTASDGTRKDAAAAIAMTAALDDVLDVLDAATEEMSGRGIDAAVTGHSRQAVRDAVKVGIQNGDILTTDGPKRSVLHSLNPSSAPVRRSAPSVRQRTESVCASAPSPLGDGAHRTHDTDGEQEFSAPPVEEVFDPATGDPAFTIEWVDCTVCGDQLAPAATIGGFTTCPSCDLGGQ